MRNTCLWLGSVVALSLLSGQAAEKTPAKAAPVMTADVKALVNRMQEFYEKTQDFTAQFRQEYTYKTFKRTLTSTGTVTFKKPALMRWDYEKPTVKSFILAGNRVTAYEPEAQTLTFAKMESHQLSASVTFLWGRGKLASEFAIVQKPCEKCTGVFLEMTPLKPDTRFQKIFLEVDSKTAQVLRSIVVDPDGSENAISFLNLKPNTQIPASFFALSPPPGTTIQDFTGNPEKAK